MSDVTIGKLPEWEPRIYVAEGAGKITCELSNSDLYLKLCVVIRQKGWSSSVG